MAGNRAERLAEGKRLWPLSQTVAGRALSVAKSKDGHVFVSMFPAGGREPGRRTRVRRAMQLSRLACAGLLLGVALDDPSAEDYVRDVRLEIGWLGSPAVLENPTSPPPVTARLVNESDTRTYPVLGAGGGSRRGPVQPSMRWSLERLATKGSWSAWDSGARGTRADSLGSDWREGVVALGPGASLDLRLADQLSFTLHHLLLARSLRAQGHELGGRGLGGRGSHRSPLDE